MNLQITHKKLDQIKRKFEIEFGSFHFGFIRIYFGFLLTACFFSSSIAQRVLFPQIKDQVSRIEFSLPQEIYVKMKRTTTREVTFKPDTFTINGLTLPVDDMHTRGKTTLHFRRKSFTVSLKKKVSFSGKHGEVDLDHFYLISMSLDKHYFHNRLAFQSLAQLGLFPLFYNYVEVIINGNSDGLYLFVQRPADYALVDLGSIGILRRGSTDFTTKEKFAKSDYKATRKKCRQAFKEIKYPGERSGAELYQYLNDRIDLSKYFSWLAFNYLVRNGDYTDEVFYYALPDESSTRFGIIPWDFDDILVTAPHEGKELRDQQLENQLIFSSEDKLDRIIARDSFLYGEYLNQFKKVLEILDPDTIDHIFSDLRKEMAPYFNSDAIVSASQHDFRPTQNWQDVEDNLDTILGYLKHRSFQLQQMLTKQ